MLVPTKNSRPGSFRFALATSNPHRPKTTDLLARSSQQMRLRPQGRRRKTPSAPELTLGYNRSRILTNWGFADGGLANRVLADYGRLGDRLSTREVRSNGSSNKTQKHGPNDREFQHRSLLLSAVIDRRKVT